MRKLFSRSTPFLLLFAVAKLQPAASQQALIRERKEVIRTYPFSDPNPVPPMVVNNKIARFYPYFMFDGYTTHGRDTAWSVVELENDYIKVKILPDVGGKVYGAIEKSTGKEFVYLNKVLKFRSIGIRGPWTSGGIEHNFGLDIGHAPWTAAPVDYAIIKENDGSTSCVVGGLDLASRTQWRVKIRLPKDKAYFETSALLYNPTPFHHSYLSWENAAYKTADDLRFYIPGTHHIGHDGSASPWPIDEQGRDLSWYRNNNFGESKSYHVVGSARNWFGGYYHNEQFGFGHWAPYSDAAGKKLWIWSLSRSGGIWKDLLTDTDPHYIEAQSGVKFNQADIISGFHSPYKQLFLRPGYTDTKTEYWFPVKGTEGMSDASRCGTLSVVKENDQLSIRIQALEALSDSIRVITAGKTFFTERLNLQPMELYTRKVPLHTSGIEPYEVVIGNKKLYYHSEGKEDLIDRPVLYPASANSKDPYRLFLLGEDQYSMRKYEDAFNTYQACLQQDPSHIPALTRVAEIHYRRLEYDKAIQHIKTALAINTYEPATNYLYGIILKSRGDLTRAAEAFSIAVRQLEFRSDAYAQLAGISQLQGSYEEAVLQTAKSLQYNAYNFTALQWQLSAYRKLGQTQNALAVYNRLLEIDPLNHYARFEKYLMNLKNEDLQTFRRSITNEFPQETLLELALEYVRIGMKDEAIQVLQQAEGHAISYYWLAYLHKEKAPELSRNSLKKATSLSPAFVFPFREESIPVLEWAMQQEDSWKHLYYLGLIYWHKGRTDKVAEYFQRIGDASDYAPFYIAKALLDEKKNPEMSAANLKKAWQLDAGEWRTWHYYQQHLLNKNQFEELSIVSKQAYKRFPQNPVIGMNYAKALTVSERFGEALNILKKLQILPQEHAQEGHELYEEVLLGQAISRIKAKKYKEAIKLIDESRKWPENLGAGIPYEPDTRLQDYLAAYCFAKMNQRGETEKLYDRIAQYTLAHFPFHNKILNNHLGLQVLQKTGRSSQSLEWLKEWNIQLDSLYKWNILPAQSDAVQWVMAKHQLKQAEATRLQQHILSDRSNLWQRHFFEAIQLDESF
jgi:Flp pilus assembly protein TadD